MQPGDVVHPDPMGNDQANQNNDPAQDQTQGGQMPPLDDQTPAPAADDQTNDQSTDQPVVPAEEPAAAPVPEPTTDAPEAPAAEPVVEPAPESPAATPEVAADPAPEAETPTEAPPADAPADDTANQAVASAAASGLSWEAAEFAVHERSAVWYILLGLATIGLVALAVLVLKEWLSAAVVVLMAVALVVYAHRKPRTLTYSINQTGVQIGDKAFAYTAFKGFALVPAQNQMTIELDPVKRFSPRLTIFLNEANAEAVATELGRHLPREERAADFIDKLAHSLKF